METSKAPPLQVTIHDKCHTTPPTAILGINSQRSEIQWKAAKDGATYTLHLPGGVFEGYDNPFDLTISGTSLQPQPPLKLRSYRIVNYIDDGNCLTKDNPPEVIIES